MKTKRKLSDKIFTLNLEGELTIQRAEEIKKLFWEVANQVKTVEVKLGSIDLIDLSFLQTLWFGEIFLKNKGVKLLIIANEESPLHKLVYSCGLEKEFSGLLFNKE